MTYCSLAYQTAPTSGINKKQSTTIPDLGVLPISSTLHHVSGGPASQQGLQRPSSTVPAPDESARQAGLQARVLWVAGGGPVGRLLR